MVANPKYAEPDEPVQTFPSDKYPNGQYSTQASALGCLSPLLRHRVHGKMSGPSQTEQFT